MREPLHCRECDDVSCPGFTRPAKPEPLPALRPTHIASPAVQAAAMQAIREQLAANKTRKQEDGR